jgi:hypothetical protein
MPRTNEICNTVNNSTCTATSAHETCTRFVAFIKANYPQVENIKYKRVNRRHNFRARYGIRVLSARSKTPEYAMARFMLEILRKLFLERLMTPEEYHTHRQELKRRTIMNYAIYESHA